MRMPNLSTYMPVRSSTKGFFLRVPFDMMNEIRAQRNHDQSLSILFSRGGMSAYEILCNLDDIGLWGKRYPPQSDKDNEEELVRRVTEWINATYTTPTTTP